MLMPLLRQDTALTIWGVLTEYSFCCFVSVAITCTYHGRRRVLQTHVALTMCLGRDVLFLHDVFSTVSKERGWTRKKPA